MHCLEVDTNPSKKLPHNVSQQLAVEFVLCLTEGYGTGGTDGTLQYVRGNYTSLKGTKLTVVAKIRRTSFISHNI